MRSPQASRRGGRGLWLVHAVLAVGAIVMIAPFIYQVLTTLKTYSDATTIPPQILPRHWYWANFSQVFRNIPFGSMFSVSVIVTASEVAGHAILCTTAAYGFARLRFPGRDALFVITLSVMMVPKEVFLVPQFEIINKLNLHNTVPAIVLPHLFSVFGVFLMRQYFRSIPPDVEEAARLDGAGPLRTFWSVMLPLGRSGIITLALFSLLSSWNGLLWPLIVIDDPNRMPLTAGLATLQGETFSNIPVLLAGSLMANLPLIVLFVLLQRQFIQGIALGAAKG